MKRRTLLFALTLSLLLSACAAQKLTEEENGGYQLYFLSREASAGGDDAIASETVGIEGDTSLTLNELAETLLTALLNGPSQPQLSSPFPSGTTLSSVSVSGKCAEVNFSTAYSCLSGVELSLADYCVTLTLTQVDGINAVHITANGRELPYRRVQLLTAADALLGSRETGLRPVTVQLYFYDTELGELRAEQQTLALREGETRVNALLDAMLLGPEGDSPLVSLLPEGFYILASRIENGVCYLNISSDAPMPDNETDRKLMFTALEQSLCSLSGVERVQFLLDGESMDAQEQPHMPDAPPTAP